MATAWDALQHAYGSAEDTPSYLCQLLDEDPEVQAEALGMLDMSVLHQGSLYSSTLPAARFVAAILTHPQTFAEHESFFPWDDRTRPLRAALLDWLGQIVDSASYGEAPGGEGEYGDEYGDEHDGDGDGELDDELEAIRACRSIRPELYDAVEPILDDPHPDTREAALATVTLLLKAPDLAEFVPRAAQRLRSVLEADGSRRERASALLAMGAWGQDTTGFLNDPDPAVRACAALAPGCAHLTRATAVLLEALQNPAEVDQWFPDPLPQVDGWFRFTLLKAVLDRVDAFEDLAPAAAALIPLASDYTVDCDWGPLLVKAFPNGHGPGQPLTVAQRELLQAVTANEECWGNMGNKIRWLREAGLPEQRDAIRAVL
ncbi:HEAT repeat domain-containing protein [Streptomyces sp. NBC_01214]|uniref:HEAT repeat domain-containing protein n=1 Tax=Streptomyces sp. NBC_01214 TaxID=2903777 RepID=UPI0022551C49|nr:HEAT repeat domain-containing protein [Streptomyces sp. NBC_01214]MCX4804357.1 HEAT repeat domain-containing protein [Streptomyces sp. NBC_01214]